MKMGWRDKFFRYAIFESISDIKIRFSYSIVVFGIYFKIEFIKFFFLKIHYVTETTD